MKKVILILLAIMIFGCVVANAAELPTNWTAPVSDGCYYVYWSSTDNIYKCFVCIDSSATVTRTYNSSANKYFLRATSGQFYVYHSVDSVTWTTQGTSFGSDFAVGASSKILYSTDNIVNTEDGTVFFSGIPLTLMEVTTVSLGNLITTFGDSLGVLLPIGVIVLCLILAMYLIPRLLRLWI